MKPWLRDAATWQVGDASDPNLIARLGPQDVVVANNFLCHLEPSSAERCLRNLAQLVAPVDTCSSRESIWMSGPASHSTSAGSRFRN